MPKAHSKLPFGSAMLSHGAKRTIETIENILLLSAPFLLGLYLGSLLPLPAFF